MIEVKRIFFVIFAGGLVVQVLSVNKDLNIGDECELFNNQRGICKPVSECKYYETEATEEVKRKFLRMPYLCSFTYPYGVISMNVCCPVEKESQKRSSVKACETYSNKPHPPHLQVEKIVEGTRADPAEFPYFAALQYIQENKTSFGCGGILISKNFVLSAAHCTRKSQVINLIRLGKTSLLDESDDKFTKIDVGVKRVIPHPQYKTFEKYHDIALIELKTPVTELTYNVWPACLTTGVEADITSLQIAGFGRTNTTHEKANQGSDWMMKAVIEEIPFEECLYNYTENYGKSWPYELPRKIVAETQICARNRTSRANTCQGDSGSGLMYNRNEKFYVHGITSFGPGCLSKIPSIYTRVSYYLKWIEDIVWPESVQKA